MAVARWIETDSLSNQDISAALAIGVYTADADRMIVCDVSLDAVAGNGDYVIYLTRRINGAGSSYVMLPKTTCAAASGETAIAMQSGAITVLSGDVVTCYVKGLAGDDTTPDTIVRWFEMAALRPTTAGRTLDVSSTGEAGVDWANVGGATTTVALTNTTISTSQAVDATKISGDSTAADRLEAILDAMPSGAVVDDNDPDPTTLLFETNLSEATNDHYNGAFVVFTSGALLGQSRKISDYDGTTKVLTVATAFTEAPTAADTFIILGRSE